MQEADEIVNLKQLKFRTIGSVYTYSYDFEFFYFKNNEFKHITNFQAEPIPSEYLYYIVIFFLL